MFKLPGRSRRFGVGKQVGSVVYVHRLYECHLPGEVVRSGKRSLSAGFRYDVVRYDWSRNRISFIRVPDFDHAPEPRIHDIVSVEGGVVTSRTLGGRVLYHHKWLFVADDYSGFDVAESRLRSITWLSLPGIDRRRVGQRDYWQGHVIPQLANANDTCH